MSKLSDIRALQARMVADGFDSRAIATAIMRQFGRRPRVAWRLAHGLSQAAAAERFNARFSTVNMSAKRLSEYERWPHGGERPSANTICRLAELYGTRPAELIDDLDLQHYPESDIHVVRALMQGDHDDIPQSAPEAGVDVAYRRSEDEPDYSRDPEGVVMAAAHEGSEHAEDIERRDIGTATIEQLRADVIRLSQDYMIRDPFPVFMEMIRVRRRIWSVLERRLWPRDRTELHFLAGVLNGLMAAAANGLGNRQAAEELIRTGWAFANTIDHRPLMAWLRLEQSNIVFWDRPRQSRELARLGLRHLSQGPNAAQLHLRYSRAAARLGDADGARQAIIAAHEARNHDHRDDLLDIGGEFGLSAATEHYYAGSTLLEISDEGAQRAAIAELETADTLYSAGPEPGEEHYWGYVVCAKIDLATVQLRVGQLDAADMILEGVLTLPPDQRIEALLKRLQRVRPELAKPRYRGQAHAAALDEAIEGFSRETIVNDLRELPSGSA